MARVQRTWQRTYRFGLFGFGDDRHFVFAEADAPFGRSGSRSDGWRGSGYGQPFLRRQSHGLSAGEGGSHSVATSSRAREGEAFSTQTVTIAQYANGQGQKRDRSFERRGIGE